MCFGTGREGDGQLLTVVWVEVLTQPKPAYETVLICLVPLICFCFFPITKKMPEAQDKIHFGSVFQSLICFT